MTTAGVDLRRKTINETRFARVLFQCKRSTIPHPSPAVPLAVAPHPLVVTPRADNVLIYRLILQNGLTLKNVIEFEW